MQLRSLLWITSTKLCIRKHVPKLGGFRRRGASTICTPIQYVRSRQLRLHTESYTINHCLLLCCVKFMHLAPTPIFKGFRHSGSHRHRHVYISCLFQWQIGRHFLCDNPSHSSPTSPCGFSIPIQLLNRCEKINMAPFCFVLQFSGSRKPHTICQNNFLETAHPNHPKTVVKRLRWHYYTDYKGVCLFRGYIFVKFSLSLSTIGILVSLLCV